MRVSIKLLPAAVLGLAMWSCALPQSAADPATAGPAAAKPGAATLSFLHTDGAKIVNASGQAVTLNGVNLGGWLVEEPWMQPFVTTPPPDAPAGSVPIVDHVSLWDTAQARFGADGMQRLRTAFRENWITAADFDRIHADGLNCVRLPFLVSLLDEPGGMRWLDQAIAWAGQRGIYVILDMHGAPGGQSGEAHTGQKGRNEFFKDPANVALAAADWRRIALRYRDNPAVAGYDLINEPTGMPNSDTMYVVQDRLYSAIRAVDSRHMVIVEDGYSGAQWMPFPGPAGWRNVVYSTHYYDFPAKTPADQQAAFDAYVAALLKERDRRGIPYYVGEFGFEPAGTPEVFGNAIREMSADGLSWTTWTYKVMWQPGGHSLWAVYCNAQPTRLLDFYTDSMPQLLHEFAGLRTENLATDSGIAQQFRARADTPAPRQAASAQKTQD